MGFLFELCLMFAEQEDVFLYIIMLDLYGKQDGFIQLNSIE